MKAQVPLAATARNTFDVVVLGGGLAGSVAAKKAAEAGRRVAIVRGGGGATVHSSGAFDVASPPRGPASGAETFGASIRDLMTALFRRDPHHPYAIVAANDPAAAIGLLEEATEDLFRDLEAEGLLHRGSLARNLWLATPGGHVKESAFAQAAIAAGDLLSLAKARLAIVGIEEAGEAEARARAAGIRRELDARGFFGVRELLPLAVAAPAGAGRARDDLSIAMALDEKGAAEAWAVAVAEALDRAAPKSTHAIFPPVLGLREHRKTVLALREASGREILETVALPPSVPGRRLERALAAILEKKGVAVIPGRVARAEAAAGSLRRIAVLSADGAIEAIEGRAFVLASGRFLGGGIRAGNALGEPLFDLPLFYRGRPIEELRREEWFERHVVSAHPAFSFGVRCGIDLRPEGRAGGPAFENLYAAGSVLSGGSFVADRTGLGAALATGYVAGMNAAEAAS